MRKFEVGKFGQPDINGVLRAKRESFLGTMEVLIASILFGYIVNYLTNLDKSYFHSRAFFHYWVLIDCMYMFFTLGYVYFSKYL